MLWSSDGLLDKEIDGPALGSESFPLIPLVESEYPLDSDA
jgi:hypothetical protein